MLMSILYMRMIVSNGRVPKLKNKHPSRSDYSQSKIKIVRLSMLSEIYAMLTDVSDCHSAEDFIRSLIINSMPSQFVNLGHLFMSLRHIS
jgi:hypothetical protein